MKILSTLLFLILSNLSNLASANELKKVSITQIVAHPSLDKVRLGIIEGLYRSGYEDKKTTHIDYQNAAGNIALANQIAKRFTSKKSDIIIAIATPSAQAAFNSAKSTSIPVVFASITDPVKAKLVSSLVDSSKNITGTINPSAIKEQIELIRKYIPNLKKIGIIINYSEANSVELLNEAKKEAARLGVGIETASCISSAEVGAATKALIKKVDAILLLQDNTVASAVSALMKVTNKYNIPVFSSYIEAVDYGAVAALAYDEYEIGIQTGVMAAKILNGVPVKNLPIEKPHNLKLVINKEAMAKLNIKS